MAPATYTAFGELVDGDNHRYGYAGAWGYQSHDDLPYLHVGYRYYDPNSGRFLQRDPIGVLGGGNVYRYVMNAPANIVDPTGLWSWEKAAVGAAAGALAGSLGGPWSGAAWCVAGFVAGGYEEGDLRRLCERYTPAELSREEIDALVDRASEGDVWY